MSREQYGTSISHDVEECGDIVEITLEHSAIITRESGDYWHPPTFDIEWSTPEIFSVVIYNEDTNSRQEVSMGSEHWDQAMSYVKVNEHDLNDVAEQEYLNQ